MNPIVTDYETLKAQRTAKALGYYYLTMSDADGKPIAYTVWAATAGLILEAPVTSDVDIADFLTIVQPYATETPSGSPQVAALVAGPVEVYIKQERRTWPGHYMPVPVAIPTPAGLTRYTDETIPDLTLGVDILAVRVYTTGAAMGDEIAAAKVMVGPVSQVAADASAGDIVVMLAGPRKVLQVQAFGGVLDEGLFMSFGVDDVTAAMINAAGGTGPNPTPELTEYPIGRILRPAQDLGGGNVVVPIVLSTPLIADVPAGVPGNLIQRWCWKPLPIEPDQLMILGNESFIAGNVPAGAVIRLGYFNAGANDFIARAYFACLY